MATCCWENFYVHFAQVLMTVQGSDPAARLPAASEEEEKDAVHPHGFRDGTSSR